MYGDGNSSRDYTYIDDIVKGIISAIEYEKSDFEIINLGNNQAVKLSDLITTIESVLNKKAVIENLPDQPGDVPKTYADLTKAKKLLKYEPHTSLKEGLEKFYKWFEENRGLLVW